MKGDFSRITNILTADQHYSLVLMQQGRVQLDSDWNDQALIQWRSMQSLSQDLLGEHCASKDSFKISAVDGKNTNFKINPGRYYLDGLVCEHQDEFDYHQQPHFDYQSITDKTDTDQSDAADGKYIVYLHAWNRHVTGIEDDYLREVALGGPDTSTRLKTMWQVKVKFLDTTAPDAIEIKPDSDYAEFVTWVDPDRAAKQASLVAQAKKPGAHTELCIIAPDSRYRGTENQLYRVEVHRSGAAYSKAKNNASDCATFKWSRENGSVVFPVKDVSGSSVTLANTGRDPRFSLQVGDWVELLDEADARNAGSSKPSKNLLKVLNIDPESLLVSLSAEHPWSSDELQSPLLRRWDHHSDNDHGALNITETDNWLELEDGIEIKFCADKTKSENNVVYNAGDWWWVTARTETGDVEWPVDRDNNLQHLPPQDAGHRYAPLAELTMTDGVLTVDADLRRVIKPLWMTV